jgi:NTE family protein
MSDAPIRIAVVLAGAVAKGAFEAGALHELARRNVQIVRIVATSSGALNGALLASAVRTRSIAASTDRLVELWRDRAGWSDVFHASFHAVANRQGLSDRTRVLELLRREIKPSPQGDDIALRLLVAPLAGTTGVIGDHPATTFEAMLEFFGVDFATQPALDRLFDAATASSAFPLVFAPVELGALGPCVDGGAVNNTPVKWALDGTEDDRIDAIVIVATSAELRTTPPGELHGLGLASHLADMLIGERLYRDLHEAETINERLAALTALVDSGAITATQHDQILTAIGWQGWRRVKLVQIRPLEELPGSSFSGFFEDHLRQQYIAAGAARARAVLDAAGW